MNIEVLISTMQQKDLSLIDKMNISTDALIINQLNRCDSQISTLSEEKVRMLSFNEKGLSRSRNKAIENADGEICIIADDDVEYHENYNDIISEAYNKYTEADIIAFSVRRKGGRNLKKAENRFKKVNLLSSMRLSSVQLTFKRKSIVNKGIKFNELFGSGSNEYQMGEENIFLSECFRKNCKIIFIPLEIGIVTHEESTWFIGFNEKYFFDRGEIGRAHV